MRNKEFKNLIEKLSEQNFVFDVSRKFPWFIEQTQIEATTKEVQEKIMGFSCAIQNYLIINGDEYE